MTMNVGRQIAELKRMTVTELRRKHIEAFGEPTRSGHKDYLVKRIAWRLQAQESGDLSERARKRAEQLANDADLRTTAPKHPTDDTAPGITTRAATLPPTDHDSRLPLPGSLLTRRYKGREIVVKVRPKGFEYEGEVYRSLSAVAKAVTGKHWNGYHFFKLQPPGNNGDTDE
ncbi:MAG: DUF2924 domain-containing protein [Phycisphaera sp.]|nr:DUF2924 domain-containing protein [Phycisphaera sp.]